MTHGQIKAMAKLTFDCDVRVCCGKFMVSRYDDQQMLAGVMRGDMIAETDKRDHRARHRRNELPDISPEDFIESIEEYMPRPTEAR